MHTWAASWSEDLLLKVQETESIELATFVGPGQRTTDVSLRSDEQLRQLWPSNVSVIYVDITGLSHHIWAPLVKSALNQGYDVKVVYVEPHSYSKAALSNPAQPYDLSARIRGIAPLPGFASLLDDSADGAFVPLLGFEGARLAFMMEQVQPHHDHIYPVIGLPGFRAHYVYETYFGNCRPLSASGAHERTEYVAADCPFSVMRLLARISAKHPSLALRVALIGTKPHALGAVLYKLYHRRDTELIYDHPIRGANRSTGSDRLHVYHTVSIKTS
jgi:hypothetical protein